jgi:gamma-glutamyl-gamma-aminobutyrate hydrolase PuuD
VPPLIGLNMSIESTAVSGVERLFVPPDYVAAVTGAGGVPLCIPPGEDLATIREIIPRLRGFLFIGGADYRPEHYGGHPQPAEELVHPRRDRFDLALAKIILEETDLPVLGICGGHQLLAIVRSGALIQDIKTEWRPPGGGSPLPHSLPDRERRRGDEAPAVFLDSITATTPAEEGKEEETRRDDTVAPGEKGVATDPTAGKAYKTATGESANPPAATRGRVHPADSKDCYLHSVRFAPSSLAARATGTPPGEALAANSFHHQAVHPERVGKDLVASAWSSDGVIEAIEPAPGSAWAGAGRFVLGVQWHPERLPNEEPHRRLFRSLVLAAVGAGRRQSA